MAQLTYVWGYPMVNMMNRRSRLGAAPEPGRLGGVLPASPVGQISMLNDYIEPAERFIACPNQDVVYGLGFFSLDEQPVVVTLVYSDDGSLTIYVGHTPPGAERESNWLPAPGCNILAVPPRLGRVAKERRAIEMAG
ncbi:DUF1214 domain-containing protein [Leifsonia sp. ZF2019]|uniref:DUF1214 domain-containing protein n=1 Tax=Leifsonia sp. ZF2019 TaxID=2781978 RepID=UPI001CBCB676|nr:DUF1214 domain-containing protein [Leifsonia sp. ZF2019]